MILKSWTRLGGVGLVIAAALFWSADSRGETAVTPAVGVIRLDVPAGLSLVSVPMEQNDGSAHTLDSVFGSALPADSQVIMFVPGSGYLTYQYSSRRGWRIGDQSAGSTELARGKGFWVRNTGSNTVTLYLSGKVPKSQVQIGLLGNGNLQLTSFSFPLNLFIQNINEQGGLTPASDDEIIVFQGGAFQVHKYSTRAKAWRDSTGGTSQLIIQPGQAIWYRRVGQSTTWTQALPSGIDL